MTETIAEPPPQILRPDSFRRGVAHRHAGEGLGVPDVYLGVNAAITARSVVLIFPRGRSVRISSPSSARAQATRTRQVRISRPPLSTSVLGLRHGHSYSVRKPTRSGGPASHGILPVTCGVEGAHFELFRPEDSPIVVGVIAWSARVYYVCGRTHFESAVREEARAELKDQSEAKDGVLSTEAGSESSGEWMVMDRYCWFCGTHGAVFNSATRCSKCGELQRLCLREGEGGDL